MKLCNYVASLLHYSEAIALQPQNVRFLCARSTCLMTLGNYELAVEDAMKAISLDSKHRRSYYIAMDCYIALGDLIRLENLITQWRRIVPGIDSIDENQVPKLITLKNLQRDINKYPLCSNYETILKCVDRALEISTACDELHLMKMRLHVGLELPVTEKMVENRTNKYIGQVCEKNFLDLLQLFYNDNLKLCMTTAAKMLELLPKKFSAIENILDTSRCLIEGFERGLYVC